MTQNQEPQITARLEVIEDEATPRYLEPTTLDLSPPEIAALELEKTKPLGELRAKAAVAAGIETSQPEPDDRGQHCRA
jgi:hypothetical protein